MNLIETGSHAATDRQVQLGLVWLSLVAALCWLVLLVGALTTGAGAESTTPSTGTPAPTPYGAGQLLLVTALWGGMSTAVMLPLAIRPTILVARAARWHCAPMPRLRTALFVLGHLLPCAGFTLLAALMQWTLHDAAMLDDSMAVRYPGALGLALVAAGIYQWLPAKHACLEHCRAPLPGLLADWSDDPHDALRRGVGHARTCMGSIWLLMLLPLWAGPLHPAPVAALLLLAPAEIRLAGGHWIASAGGLALLAWGTWLLFP
ncbi:DUF2182 domain-containing protein [Massilia sp. ST3]|uniref:DUF2182 domain-containing protein n=1 Tax=Massilia sp. ST3 TaxID=2824903 RepID=UPI001B83C514|nr:DUF2182 domain-containing protein [Massilia sp. ST3]MBQ5947669.1 DUF2182 domain-containing protein [Massilia sp. ST3]